MHHAASPQGSLFPEKSLRDLLRRLVYGSPNQKSLAVELFGAEHLNQSYSRLAKTLQPDPPTFFDVDWIVPTLRLLGEAATEEFLRWLLQALGYEPALRRKKAPSIEERLEDLEERVREDSQKLRRDVEDLASLRRDHEKETSNP